MMIMHASHRVTEVIHLLIHCLFNAVYNSSRHSRHMAELFVSCCTHCGHASRLWSQDGL